MEDGTRKIGANDASEHYYNRGRAAMLILRLDARMPPILTLLGAYAAASASYAIWAHVVTGDEREMRVNLAFNRISKLADVVSCLPHRGEVDVIVKDAQRLYVRVPEGAPRDKVRVYVDRQPVEARWSDSYVEFPAVTRGQQITVTYPLRIAVIHETVGSLAGSETTQKWRGNTIVDISPAGKFVPQFCRPELDRAALP